MNKKDMVQAPRGPKASGEQAIMQKIERVSRAASKLFSVRLGIGDDAALWSPRKGYETVLTTDWFLEGRHFLREVHPPDSVGWKCLARAASDIAAMGGEPRCCLLSLALPSNCVGDWLDKFLGGLTRAARRLACPLAGGDTTRSERMLISVAVIGEVKKRFAVTRAGARPGDRIFVSGRLGEAELGLREIRKNKKSEDKRNSIRQKHLYPEPRIALGRWLAEKRLASAMMDLSDGLSSDLTRLCKASGVGALIRSSHIPLSGTAFDEEFNTKERLSAALHGGDDYELLFCVPAKHVARIPHKFSSLPLTEIGEISKKEGISLIDSSGEGSRLQPMGWDPFRRKR